MAAWPGDQPRRPLSDAARREPGRVIFAGLLVAAPAAHAGWTAPRAVSPARPGTPALHDASVALGPQGRGSIIASHATPDGLGTVAQGSVRGGRVGRLTDVLAGLPVSYAPSPAGAAAFAVRSAAGVTGYFRDARAPVGPALGLSPAFVPVVAAINARGDAVLARGTSVRGAVAIVIRPRGGAPSAPIVISAPGATSLWDVAISARGHVAIVWSRDGVLEARVREGWRSSPRPAHRSTRRTSRWTATGSPTWQPSPRSPGPRR